MRSRVPLPDRASRARRRRRPSRVGASDSRGSSDGRQPDDPGADRGADADGASDQQHRGDEQVTEPIPRDPDPGPHGLDRDAQEASALGDGVAQVQSSTTLAR